MSWRATSTRVLNPSKDGDSTTSLGSLLQCPSTLSEKTFFLISNLNLPWRNLRPLPLVLSLVTWEKRPPRCPLKQAGCLLSSSKRHQPRSPGAQDLQEHHRPAADGWDPPFSRAAARWAHARPTRGAGDRRRWRPRARGAGAPGTATDAEDAALSASRSAAASGAARLAVVQTTALPWGGAKIGIAPPSPGV